MEIFKNHGDYEYSVWCGANYMALRRYNANGNQI